MPGERPAQAPTRDSRPAKDPNPGRVRRHQQRGHLTLAAAIAAVLLAAGCGQQDPTMKADSAKPASARKGGGDASAKAASSASPKSKEKKKDGTASASASPSNSAKPGSKKENSVGPSASASADGSGEDPASGSGSSGSSSGSSNGGSGGGATGAGTGSSATGSGSSGTSTASGSSGSSGSSSGSGGGTAADPAPNFPVPVEVGNATQVITVKANGSYATVTAWAKSSSGWQAQFSTSGGRVGSNGTTDGASRRQNTYTTPAGTYTITEGFGVQSGGTSMPYKVVRDGDWWVQDPESKFYNSMHGEDGADFPLTESGERGSEHLVNYPTQYAKALVINFNRWPAVPGRGAGIFLHVNGSGATAGCVSVPRATMDRIMGWIQPGAHPRIAIG